MARKCNAQLIESGATSLPSGRLPVNAGGGLIGDGHPVGATGVRQVAEAFTQLTGKAGARQIDGAKRFLPGTSAAASGRVLWWSGKRFSAWRRRLSGAIFSRGEIWRIARCMNQEFPRRFQAPRRERFWRSIENS
jgi:Thiolase, C-terminal domain